MRLIVRIFLFAMALAAVLFALNNRAPVELSLWPFPIELRLPLFLALIGVLMVGVALGAALVWVGQARHRQRARAGQSAVLRQQREIEALRVKYLDSPPAVAAGKHAASGAPSLPPPV